MANRRHDHCRAHPSLIHAAGLIPDHSSPQMPQDHLRTTLGRWPGPADRAGSGGGRGHGHRARTASAPTRAVRRRAQERRTLGSDIARIPARGLALVDPGPEVASGTHAAWQDDERWSDSASSASGDPSFFGRLRHRGWAATRAPSDGVRALRGAMRAIAHRIRPSRSSEGRSIQSLSPLPRSTAKPQSLSGRYGLANFPLHCDTSHWSVPCRFIVLACADPGEHSASTALLQMSDVTMSSAERALAHSSVFLIRNGRHSFYSTVLSSTRAFARMDPGCMIPLNSDGREVVGLFAYRRNLQRVSTIAWRSGDIVAIDNWRCLHGRIGAVDAADSRLLYRMLIR